VRDIEVDQQTHGPSAEFEVRQDLREVKGKQFFHCFEFDDDAVFDQKVDSIAGFDPDALIHNWETNLVLEMQAVHSKLIMQTRTVCAFEKAGAQRRMDFRGCLDDAFGDVFVKHRVVSSVSPVSSVVERLLVEVDKQAADRP
jgi:hypothetical protein